MSSFGLGRAPTNDAISQEDIDSSTPWMAASEGNLVLLQSSLSSLKLPVRAADENGYTLLHAAASYSQTEILKYLLENNANVHAADNDGDSALHYAGTVDSARLLVEVGKANPSQVNKEGKTAFQAKKEELEETMADDDLDDEDEDLNNLKAVVEYLATLQ